ncbi:MAG: DUF2946 family protein [Rhodoferax sp.]|uniref:DUF2946 family protein n=1 Tax=Rhodoferax sp. TaxID=50421 RepID=UPI0017DC4030|nr:DUF2946 family protein [Rhodoferax sp.]NMM14654.1 DUF2946 family protein [Rhodoferax sp.]NMM18428.1 DUF2946 family protein [Rhodoferax sp.]
MDDIVKQALAKWPNVPACYGWLGLDARGNWYMRDDRVQAQGPFADGTLQSKGSQLKHEKLIEFIQRNYEPDELGQWFFQNGPQRVYVELEATPLIWRVQDDFSIQDHTGRAARVQRCLLDEQGRVYLEADTGFGLVHSMDMSHVADAVEQGLWVPQEVLAAALPKQFHYVGSPQMLQKQ